MNKDLLQRLRSGETLGTREQLQLIIALSLPAILSQLTTVVNEYIDAAMVGRLGEGGAAAIGLVASSTWLAAGICTAAGVGFSVQIAQLIGAGRFAAARTAMRHGLLTALAFSVLLGAVGAGISGFLPGWLKAGSDIRREAGSYFRIFALSLPALQMGYTAGGMLQSSGDMKVPGMLNILSCILDMIFNCLLIFPTRVIHLGSYAFRMPGAGLGVAGAALGTALAELVCAGAMLYFLLVRSRILHLRKDDEKSPPGTYRRELKRAVSIALPVGIEQAVTGSAQVLSTRIVSPLGTVAIAANSFAVNAESLCYMPGYGIAAAASTLTGQSVGAGRRDLTKRLGWMCMALGMSVMAAAGLLLYVFAPYVLGILTPVASVKDLAVQVLRIELFAEPMFAASIVGAGVFRGAGKTRGSTAINLIGMWVIRLPLAAFLSPHMGLQGVWVAMLLDLCARGVLFLLRLWRTKTFVTPPPAP